jgi:hypothetical protein
MKLFHHLEFRTTENIYLNSEDNEEGQFRKKDFHMYEKTIISSVGKVIITCL